jgi:uncharacterized membrane protein
MAELTVLIGLALIILGMAREKLWAALHGACLIFIGTGIIEAIPVLTAFGAVGIVVMVFILAVQHYSHKP